MKKILLGIILSVALLGILLLPTFMTKQTETSKLYTSMEDCNNITIDKTTDCIVGLTREFYKYNISQIEKKISIEELKINGGVCDHWNWNYYYEEFKVRGFHVKKVRIFVNATTDHAVLMVSNNDGYCLVDQMSFDCTRFR